MKKYMLLLLISIFACSQKQAENPKETIQTEISDVKTEIRNLIRKTLKWSEKNTYANDFYPFNIDKNRYISINKEQLNRNIENLKSSNFFSSEFIKNYKNIFLKEAKKLKTKELYEGEMSDLFRGGNPWCNCQDTPGEKDYDYFGNVEIIKVSLSETKGEFYWRWEKGYWDDFKYKFKVKKESNQWRISYLEGFQL